jgi:hypothetical protein
MSDILLIGVVLIVGIGAIVGVARLLERRRQAQAPARAAEALPTPAQSQDVRLLEEKLRAENQFKSGANWFYWIAGLSLVNSVIMLLGGSWSFIIGLGATQIVDALAWIVAEDLGSDVGLGLRIVAFGLDIIIAAVVAGFGLLARKRFKWAFVVGMGLYALDGLLFLWIQDYWSIGFHLFALYGLYQGVKALDQLVVLEKSVAEMSVT